MKNLFLIFYIFSIPIFSYATHIIGGDFRVTMVNNSSSSSLYDIQLRLYRDDVNGAVQLPASVTIGIYKTGTNALQISETLYQVSSGLLPLGDSCYTPNPSQVRIEEGVYQSISSVNLPNYALGYYLQYQTCCRNGLIDNLATPTSDGISIVAMIPDPALGQNSSPDFGDYPLDAYFCVNNIKTFTWPVTDPDGDQLVYSLVAPLNQGLGLGTGNTGPGSGAYPFYPSCVFANGYSTTNMIGGTSPMSIDANTGEITASPAIQGFFAFAVRVEEFRNGLKIGEVRRDAQYASLPCSFSLNDTIITQVNNFQGSLNNDSLFFDLNNKDTFCMDLDIGLDNSNDSLYAQFSSTIDLDNYYIEPDSFLVGSSLPCNHVFNLFDSFGDGWNGATVNILVNGITVGTGVGSSFNTGTNSVFNFTASTGDTITLSNWVSGSFDTEVSWNITDGNGIIIANGTHGFVPLNVTGSCNSTGTSLAYFNWSNTNDTVLFNPYLNDSAGSCIGIGEIFKRYCIVEPCNVIDTVDFINVFSNTVNCLGGNQNETTIILLCPGYSSIKSIEKSNSINIFPNPTTHLVQIEIENYSGYHKVELYDFSGKLLEITNKTSISLADYSSGIYLLKVDYGNRIKQIKVVKE